VRRQATIVNKLGLHARAAAKLVTLAQGYDCDIVVSKDGRDANAKSIMAVMMLAAAKGAVLELQATGEGAEAALDGLESLVRDRFGEPE
jgi:phosphocarrier protein